MPWMTSTITNQGRHTHGEGCLKSFLASKRNTSCSWKGNDVKNVLAPSSLLEMMRLGLQLHREVCFPHQLDILTGCLYNVVKERIMICSVVVTGLILSKSMWSLSILLSFSASWHAEDISNFGNWEGEWHTENKTHLIRNVTESPRNPQRRLTDWSLTYHLQDLAWHIHIQFNKSGSFPAQNYWSSLKQRVLHHRQRERNKQVCHC